MPKRKFSEHADGQLTGRDESIQHALDQGQKKLHRALKTASGFETQKLTRRQKPGAKGDDAKSRFAAEADFLKALKLDEVAEFYLRRTLARTTSIAAAPKFPEWLREWAKKPSPFTDTAASNVTARLYKSPPVRAAMDETLKHVRRLLCVAGAANRKADSKGEPGKTLSADTTGSRFRKATGVQPNGRTEGPGSGAVNGDGPKRDLRGSSMESDDSMSRFDRYMDRVALSESSGSSDAEPNGHSGSEHRQLSDLAAESTLDEAVSPKLEEGPAPAARRARSLEAPKPKPQRVSKPSAPPTATTFLPSLTMGGYISGSDSDVRLSDEEAANLQIRKNRRGQRARRAIWEKKFGSGANHVKKQKQGRDHGWDVRRGATEATTKREKPKKVPNQGEAGRTKSDEARGAPGGKAGGTTPSKVRKKEDGPLHPSWEAAKKAKELKKSTAFTGEKIVFD